jgi:hypothetical protein
MKHVSMFEMSILTVLRKAFHSQNVFPLELDWGVKELGFLQVWPHRALVPTYERFSLRNDILMLNIIDDYLGKLLQVVSQTQIMVDGLF